MPMTKKTVLIAAGGTGGHIFPGLAVAQALIARGCEVIWVGTIQGLEAKIVPAAGITLKTIKVQGLRGKGIKRLVMAPIKLIQALQQASRCIQQIKPDVVLGMGGYVSGPVGLAAWLHRKPLIIHEQNAIAGLTNRVLSYFSRYVLESFPATFSVSKKIVYTGNPVRAAILALASAQTKSKTSEHQPLHILILGGSLGAKPINQVLPATMTKFTTEQRPHIWHQTGEAGWEETQKAYQLLGLTECRVEPFIQDMAAAYAWADLVICRAGATTVAELAAIGLPAIFIPFPHAVDDHQTANAKNLAKIHAASILAQSELTAERLFQEVAHLVNNPTILQQMAQQARLATATDAVTKVVNICIEVSHAR
jgi:UDP-N-acetylglucosamine--N-acetylmuramyl-(pentapeptide) pyrophosphoryl-undecaprenol N-acetylglucosamine transferase